MPALQEQFTAFQQSLSPSQRQQIVTPEDGENRLLTILFVDMSSSVKATVELHPEDAAGLMQEVLQPMVDGILAHGGRVNQFLGDAVLAFFGTPQAHENDPERAILAALQIREAVQQRGLNVTAGINTGEVYLGETGRGPQQEVRAVGTAINLAARLQQKAQPGQILVGESVYRQTRRAFAFARHLVEAKGFAQPMPAYEVLHPLSHPEKVRGIEGLRAALVGRGKEVAQLAEALAAARAGQGQIVSIIGEAGIGKSRLVAELKERAISPAQDQPMPLWLEGRCLDIGMAVSYWPFLDLLRGYFGFESRDDDRARGNRLAATLDDLIQHGDLTATRSQEMLPRLGHLLSARFGSELDDRLKAASPEQIKHQTFLALRDLCAALARRQPLILVLEDLHWADSLSLDLVSVLMETLPLGPLLLLCVYRPERAHKCWHLAAVATRKCPERYTELALRELTPQQSRHLVESLLHIEALPLTVKEMILEKAQGNPFFVEEVVRALLDAGMVYHDGTVWRAHEDIATVAVPDSVQSVILSRVDRLDQETRRVLQSAAVIGRLFRRRLLEQVVQQEGELDRALDELEDRALIYEERVLPEVEYSFQHVLTQETVYQNILRRRRAVLHQQVAEALEALYQDSLADYYEQLAQHYDQAGVQEKALLYLERGGDKAQAQYANAIAETSYRDLVERLDGLGRTQDAARAREKLGLVLYLTARLEAALAALEQAAEAYDATGDLKGVGRATALMGLVYQSVAMAQVGVERLQSLAERLEAHGPSRELIQLYYALAELLWGCRRYREEMAVAERSVELAHVMADERSLARALGGYSLAHLMLGAFSEAQRIAEEALPLAESVGELECLAQSLYTLSVIFLRYGELERSRAYCERELAVVERIGQSIRIVAATAQRGLIAYVRGEWTQARRDAERALALSGQIGISWASPLPLSVLGLICYAEGEWKEARHYLEDCVAWAERVGDPPGEHVAPAVLGECDLLEGEPGKARARWLHYWILSDGERAARHSCCQPMHGRTWSWATWRRQRISWSKRPRRRGTRATG